MHKKSAHRLTAWWGSRVCVRMWLSFLPIERMIGAFVLVRGADASMQYLVFVNVVSFTFNAAVPFWAIYRNSLTVDDSAGEKDGEDNKVQLRKGDGGLQGLFKGEIIHAVHSFWVNGCKFKRCHWFTSKTKEEEWEKACGAEEHL